MSPARLALYLAAAALACGSTGQPVPANPLDAGARPDASGSESDAATDAGAPDASSTDVSATDATPIDATPTDAPTTDAASTDASSPDAGPLRWTSVAASSTGHACALRSDGTLWCWGLDDHGQTGRPPVDAASTCRLRGTTPARTLPCDPRARRATEFTDVTQVAAGNGSTCVLRADGSVWCFGLNDAGQLGQGRGSTTAQPTPMRVDLPPARHIALGAFHACAVLMDGAVRCWGSNKFAQCGVAVASSPMRCDEGDGTLSGCAPSPVAVPGVTNARAVALGRWHSCALLGDGTVRCWGLNDSAQLGNGLVEPESSPRATPVTPTLDRVTAVAAGGSHTCALRDDGTVRCWGWAEVGQIADATTTACTLPGASFQCARSPTPISSPTGVTSLATGRYNTCATGAEGVTRCFGRNDNGQVGVAPSDRETCLVVPDRFPCVRSPAEVSLAAAASLSLGDYHACAVTRAGDVRCWGWNQFGQLGDGTTDDRSTPVLLVRAD